MTSSKRNNPPLSLTIMRLMFKVLTPVFPSLMNQFAYNLWFTPMRTKATEKEQDFIKSARADFLKVKDFKIRVWSWGKGPTVLFIHGWGGRGLQVSAFIETLCSMGFNVVSFDMPAHGESDGKRTNGFEIVEVMNEVVKQIENFHSVITHSFGGMLFGYYYSPQLSLKNIVMICPPATLHTAFDQFITTLQLPQSIQEYMLKMLERNFGQDLFERLSLLQNGTKITQPVLLVHDRQDDVVPYQDSQDIMKILQQGTLYETNELGHRKILYDKALIERISHFISKN
ncbi:MAG: alpha/beta fold hydrolase [Gammaproteobacteria bacterium]|nr:alpha/beta fold hydrolase [Gammaproteobacteria bacterium]